MMAWGKYIRFHQQPSITAALNTIISPVYSEWTMGGQAHPACNGVNEEFKYRTRDYGGSEGADWLKATISAFLGRWSVNGTQGEAYWSNGPLMRCYTVCVPSTYIQMLAKMLVTPLWDMCSKKNYKNNKIRLNSAHKHVLSGWRDVLKVEIDLSTLTHGHLTLSAESIHLSIYPHVNPFILC